MAKDLIERASAAQLFAASAACAACIAGLTQSAAHAGVLRTLRDVVGGLGYSEALGIADATVSLTYASRYDANFMPIMHQRAALMGERMMKWKNACAAYAGQPAPYAPRRRDVAWSL